MVGRWRPIVVGGVVGACLLAALSPCRAVVTRIVYETFEAGTLDPGLWPNITENTDGDLSLDSSYLFTGRWTLKAEVTGGTAARHARAEGHFASSKHLHWRTAFNPVTLNMTGGGNIAHFVSLCQNAGAFKLQFNFQDIGSTYGVGINAKDDDGAITAGIEYRDTVEVGWHWLDIYADQADEPGGAYFIYVDGDLIWYADTLDLDVNLIDSMRVGLSTGPTQTNSGYALFDEITIDTMPYAPPSGYFTEGPTSGESKILQIEEILK